MPQSIFMSSFRAALFDVDGTLVDSIEGLRRGLHDAFGAYGAGPEWTPERIQTLIGTPLREQMRIAVGPDAPESLVDEASDYAIGRFAVHHATLTLFSPAVEALRACHAAGIKTALVTSKNAREIEDFTPKFPALEAVDAIVCASDVYEPKPHPESALLACEQLGVNPGDAVMIGDSTFDLRCAKGAGLTAIAVTYGAMPRARLLEEEPALAFDTPDELLRWVQETIYFRHEKENERLAETG